MGVVYKAHDTKLGRPVVLKFLPPFLAADEQAKERFLIEAQAAAALDHPNLCTIYEIGETDEGRLFIAMAFYEGETLKEKIARGPLDVHEALDYAAQIARGLAKAHAAGIIHRDIKPANVLVTSEGAAKILDFGIAKMRGVALTKTGTTPGTVAYMSPEQARGEPVDHRTDLWSLGVVLYEMLTGERPFRGEHEQAVIYSLLNEDSASVEGLRPEIPAALGRVVATCLEKDPSARYQQIAEVQTDLEALAANTGSTGRAPAWKKPALRYGSLISLLAVLLVAGSLYLWPQLQDRSTATETLAAETAAHAPRRLAVLPLANISPDPQDAYFADGMTEELISRLSRLDGLRLIARTSTMQYRDTEKSVAEIGRELGVGTILEGSVRKVGEQVRITMQLVDAESEENLWAEEYGAEVKNVLAAQSKIAQRVADALNVQVQAGERQRLTKRGTNNPEAYKLYLKGRYFWNKRSSEGMQKGKTYLQQALDRDPTFAEAWAGLADVYNTFGSYGLLPVDEAYPRARAAAEKALAIDEDLAEAHASLAAALSSYYWRWDEAERHFRRAIDLNPNRTAALYWFSEFLAEHGRFDEALVMAQRAQEVALLSLIASADEGRAYYLARRYDEAIDQLQKTLERGPQFVAYLYLGLAYLQKGRPAQAIATLEQGRTHYASIPTMQALLGHAYARAGRLQDARRVLDTLRAQRQERSVHAFDIAAVHTGLGNTDRAFEWLDRAYEERNWQLGFLKTEPTLDPLRTDPRFQALLEKVGLAEAASPAR